MAALTGPTASPTAFSSAELILTSAPAPGRVLVDRALVILLPASGVAAVLPANTLTRGLAPAPPCAALAAAVADILTATVATVPASLAVLAPVSKTKPKTKTKTMRPKLSLL
jgi:hypothetical protein